MKHYVINLERAAGRRHAVTKAFADRGLEFEMLSGFDWKLLKEEDYAIVDRRVRDRQGKRPMRPGAIGCWLSHREAMHRLIRSGDNMAAVFEDDIVLDPDVKHVLAEIEATDVEFDIVFLHRFKSEQRYTPIKQLTPSHWLGIIKYSDQGTLAYVIKRRSAECFLNRHARITQNIDHEMHAYWSNNLITYTLNPPVVLLPNSPQKSIIGEIPKQRRRHTALSAARRAVSLVREHCARRSAFRSRLRLGR